MVDTYPVDQEAQGFFAVCHGIVVETALVNAGRLRIAARVRSPVPVAVEPSHHEARGASAVGDTGAQVGTRLQHTARDEDRGHYRIIEEHPETVREAVPGDAL